MTTLVRRIWEGLRGMGGAPWDEQCASGPPVPEEERCRALHCDSVRLTEMDEGCRAVVACLELPGSSEARKLAALGVLPGTEVVLDQAFPAYVIRVGYSELALDRTLAEHVRVHPG